MNKTDVRTRQWAQRIFFAVLILGVGGIGCLVATLWGVYAEGQAESLVEMGGGAIVDSALFSSAVTEADYDTIAREILRQEIDHRVLGLYDGVWIHRTCAGIDSSVKFIGLDYSFRYYGHNLDAFVRIHPEQSEVEWSYVISGPLGGDALDLSSRRVDIPQAIKIIDENGGGEFSQMARGDCDIWVDFMSSVGNEVLLVRYQTSEKVLCGFVNSQTGDFSINVATKIDDCSK